MNFKIGQIVVFNNANYVVMDAQKHIINGIEKTYLHIRDIVSNDVINVDSIQVKLVDLGTKPVPNSFDAFEDDSKHVEEDIIGGKTEQLNDLFAKVGQESTERFFDLGDTTDLSMEYEKPERIKEQTLDSIDSFDIDSIDLEQSFVIPRTEFLQPRRQNQGFQKQEVNATFSDLSVAKILPTHDFKQSDHQNVNESSVIIQPRREGHGIPKPTNIESENKFIHKINAVNNNEFDNVIRAKKNNSEIESQVPHANASIQNINMFDKKPEPEKPKFIENDTNFAEDIKQLIKNDATNVTALTKGKEDTFDDSSITSETKKILLNQITPKAQKYREKQQDFLNANTMTSDYANTSAKTNDLNLRFDEFTKEAIEDKKDPADYILENSSNSPREIIGNSKMFKKFKHMSNALIVLVVLTIAAPIIGIIFGAISNKISHIFVISFSSSLQTMISSILFVIISPTLLVTTVIYGTAYLVMTLKQQYRRLAYFNFELKKVATIVESLQDFSNESSAFMIKLHNESKDVKQQIKKISRLSGASLVQDMLSKGKDKIH